MSSRSGRHITSASHPSGLLPRGGSASVRLCPSLSVALSLRLSGLFLVRVQWRTQSGIFVGNSESHSPEAKKIERSSTSCSIDIPSLLVLIKFLFKVMLFNVHLFCITPYVHNLSYLNLFCTMTRTLSLPLAPPLYECRPQPGRKPLRL